MRRRRVVRGPRVRALLAAACLLSAALATVQGTVGASPAAAAEPSFSFGAVGDEGATANAQAVMRAIGAARPDFFLNLGDLSYDQVTPDAWCQMVKDNVNIGAGLPVGDPYGQNFPFAVSAGNHDAAELDPFVAPGCLPDRLQATASPVGAYGREYYVDQPAASPLARIIVTSPGLGYDYSAGSPHYQWVSDAIDSARAAGIKWVIVADHVDYISTGDKTNEVGADLFNLLVQKKVDLILQAHDHNYQRSKQLTLGAGCPAVPTNQVNASCIADDGADGTYDKGNGPVLLIDGTGGSANYTTHPADSEAGYFAKIRGLEAGSIFGFSRINVTATTMQVTFDSVAGSGFSDAFSISSVPPSPPTATILSESWGGADGSAWPSVWSSSVAPGGSVTQAGGGGQLAVSDTSGAWARTSAAASESVADSDLLMSYRWGSTSPSAYFSVYLRGSGGWQSAYRPMNGYGLEINPNSASVNVNKNVNGVKTSLGNVANGSRVTTAKQWLRFRVVGTQVMFRTWLDGTPEPTTWAFSGTDSSLASPGRVHLSLVRGSAGARTLTVDDLLLTRAGTAPPPDTTPPTAPTGLTGTPTTSGTEVDLSWTAATDDTAVTGYRIVRNGTVLPGSVTGLSFADTTVSPSTTYTYAVRAFDAAGNVGPDSSPPISVTTPAPPPPPDTSPPTAPTGVTATSSADGTRVDLSWTAATDDTAVTGYRIVRNGTVLPGSVSTTSFADTTVSPGTAYTYVVRAFDAAGNVGPDSAPPTSVTTSSPPPPATILSESWGGVDGSAWPSVWSSSVASGGSVTQAGGGGQLGFSDTSGAWARTSAAGSEAVADSDLLMSYRWGSTSASAYFTVYLRGSGGWQNAYRPMNGYGLEFTPNSASVNVHKNVAGVKTSLANVANGSRVTTAKQWLRFRVVGTQVMFRTWLDGSPEPTTWAYSGTDSSLATAGRIHLSLVRATSNVGAKTLTLDDLLLTRA